MTIEANESYWKESSLVLNHWKWWKYSEIFRLENRKIFRDVLNMPRRDHKWKTEPYYIECRSGWELSWILATRVSESRRCFGMLAMSSSFNLFPFAAFACIEQNKQWNESIVNTFLISLSEFSERLEFWVIFIYTHLIHHRSIHIHFISMRIGQEAFTVERNEKKTHIWKTLFQCLIACESVYQKPKRIFLSMLDWNKIKEANARKQNEMV